MRVALIRTENTDSGIKKKKKWKRLNYIRKVPDKYNFVGKQRFDSNSNFSTIFTEQSKIGKSYGHNVYETLILNTNLQHLTFLENFINNNSF